MGRTKPFASVLAGKGVQNQGGNSMKLKPYGIMSMVLMFVIAIIPSIPVAASSEIKVEMNGVSNQMDTAALRKSNRTYVPLRFVSEALGVNLTWNQAIGKIVITTEDGRKPVITSSGDTNITLIPK